MRAKDTNDSNISGGSALLEERFLQIAGLEGLDSLALVGLSKNAGKTTCLNHLIRSWEKAAVKRPLGLTSIGRDGEEEDVVGGHAKPKIYIKAGTYLATARSSLARSDALLDILELSGIRSAFGEIAICKAVSDGYVELAGPSQAGELYQCEQALRAQNPQLFFVVDGALSRRSQAGGGLTQAIILTAGAESSACPEELAEKVSHALNLLSIPALKADQAQKAMQTFRQVEAARAIAVSGGAEYQVKTLELPSLVGQSQTVAALLSDEVKTLILRGAITETICKGLLAEKRFHDLTLAVEDGTRLFITPTSLRRLEKQNIRLAALHPLQVRMVCINPFKADGSPTDGRAMLKEVKKITQIPVEDYGPALA
ncbi:MAG: hypothetical protein VB108_03695 [Anaerolineaceae bacterium]|nr:hypothetical protein [Anaerolineaceae bacterium]